MLGSDKLVVSSDKQQMKALSRLLDFIIDTASGDHPFDPLLVFVKDCRSPNSGEVPKRSSLGAVSWNL